MIEKFLGSIWLAPMAGFTDSAFRQICLENGAGLVTTEMVSAKGLVYNSQSTQDLLFCNGLEKSTAVQLFGSEPEFFREAVVRPEIAKFPIIDINMGCPVPKVVKTGAGSALLNNLPLASKIIETTVLASKKPVTVKFRTGWDKDSIVAVDFAKMCQNSGASAICLHGRTREQMYSGKADWDIIEKVAKSVDIAVVGNGDINSLNMALDLIKNTAVSGVAVGRGALGNPWIFSKENAFIENENKFKIIKENYELMLEYCPKNNVVPAMRGQLNFYLKKANIGPKIRNELIQENNLENIFSTLEKIFLK